MLGPEEPLEPGDKVVDIGTGSEHVIAETSLLMLRLEGETDWRRMAEFRKIPAATSSRIVYAITFFVVAGAVVGTALLAAA